MAFNPARLNLVLEPLGGEGLRWFNYPTDDSVTAVTGAGYFTDAAKRGLRPYDLVFVSPEDASIEPYIVNIDSISDSGHATGSVSGSGHVLADNVVPMQIRRGTTAQHASFTGALAEVSYDTDKKTLVAHDGALAGGHPLQASHAVSVRTAGAVGDGVVNDGDAFVATFTDGGHVVVPPGSYNFPLGLTVTGRDTRIVIDPTAVFVGSPMNMGDMCRAIGASPTLAYDAFFKTVDSEFDGYAHVVGQSLFMVADSATPVVVSLYANCEVKASGSHGFGANFGAYVTGPGTGIVLEIDSHVTHPAGISSALVIDSVGSYASLQAIIIQPNGPDSPFIYGLNFNNASGNNAITDDVIRMTGAGTSKRFIAATEMTFTQAEIELPSFIVGPTVASANGIIRIDANAAASPLISAVGSATNVAMRIKTKGTGDLNVLGGDDVARLVVKGTTGNTYLEIANGSGGTQLTARGTDTNADIILTGKGSAGVNILDGGGASKIRANTTGIGFFAATPVAKQSVSAALSTGGAETNANICTAVNSIRTALINYGLAS